MSDSLVPKICGKNDIYVPDDGCSECMRELLLFKDEVHADYYPKTETDALLDEKQDNLIAGANITIDGNTISVNMTKADMLTTLGYKEATIKMTSISGASAEETILVKS